MDRKTITAEQNIWFNSQQIDEDNLNLEQEYNNTTKSSLVSNHIGSGVLIDGLTQLEYFSTEDVTSTIDGNVLTPKAQPSDINFGNQLEVSLDQSKVFGRRTVKCVVIGTNYNDSLIFEQFVFNRNESQFGSKHFKKIITVLINDLSGDSGKSFNLGGVLKVKEAKQSILSRDTLSVYQNYQPNIFWRDFYSLQTVDLTSLLELALPTYDISSLNIQTSEFTTRSIIKDDISTELGQKFKAKSNNIQKIRLLVSVENTEFGSETDLEWNGEMVLSVYPLQSTISCPSDIAPNLEIDFDPINSPIAQVSFSYATLLASGIQLSNTLQPVEFVLSNTSVGTNKKIEKDKYYLLSLKRSGSADKCNITLGISENLLTDSRLVVSNGEIWVDVQDESLWFEIESDTAKLSSGKIYEDGFGIEIEKTKTDSTGTYDYSLSGLSFHGNSEFTGVVSSVTSSYSEVEDTRTGGTTYSVQKKVPDVNLLSSIELSDLESTKTLLKVGKILDKNRKLVPSNIINSNLHSWSFVKNQIIIPIVDDATDGYRYDGYVNTLVSSLINGELFLSKITPNNLSSSLSYRIGDAEVRTLIYGDLNGDCIVDESDLDLLNYYSDFNLNSSPKLDSVMVSDGISPATYENGYKFLTNPSKSASSLDFQVVLKSSGAMLAQALDGVLVNSSNTLSSFSSASIDFSAITNLTDCVLLVFDGTNSENYGAFDIKSINTATDTLTIGKKYIDESVMLSLLAGNIDQDFYIGPNDGYILESYLVRERLTSFDATPYPSVTSNYYDKVGKTFQAVILKIESIVDRDDEYSTDLFTRDSVVHPIKDIFTLDVNLQDLDLLNNPVQFTIEPRLVWKNYLVVSESDVKLVPNVLTSGSGSQEPCQELCEKPIVYPVKPTFDKGKNDFFVPDNLIINNGQILNNDGSYHKVDFEVGTIMLEIPDNFYGNEQSINIFTAFVCDNESTGKTIQGFPAMKFADCTFVKSDSISKGQVKFDIAIQSFFPNLDGYSEDLDPGIIVDGKMGVYVDQTTGILTLNFTNLSYDSSTFTGSTRLQINVFLKKSGFNNNTLSVNKTIVNNLFI